jgi:hypothetical protein
MFCVIDLPNKANVTKFEVTAFDASTTGFVNNCALVRQNMTLAGNDALQVLASTHPSTATGTPGRVRGTTTSINASYKVIDHAGYAYFIQCTMRPQTLSEEFNGALVLLYGANVTFRITAGNG